MCGILLLKIQNPEKNLDDIIESSQLLKNRGPDSENIIINKDHIVIFKRLAIVDLSNNGNQPFVKNESTMVCNGEIYNHAFLKSKYNLHLKGASDCECIIHLFKKYGFSKMINMLDGVYAIAVSVKNKVYFARDRIGIRPLFYGFTKSNNFIVASYARVLIPFCNSINHMPPGTGEFDMNTGIVKISKYNWNVSTKVNNSSKSLISNRIRNILTNAVKKRLMSDRPLGCFLSGGLDSSLVASIMCKFIKPENVNTFSIGIKGSTDLYHAKICSNYLGTNHHEVIFTPEEGIKNIYNVIRDLESYDITTIRASIPMWLLSKWISKNTKDTVLLSGEGADELFCGYMYFHSSPNATKLKHESTRLIKNLYLYDVLRADRCVSSHGLELRVPFLDNTLVNYVLKIDGDFLKPYKGVEKSLLRNSFIGYLPKQILYRTKEAFSDGVSNLRKSWFEYIKEFVNTKITNKEFRLKGKEFPSKEAYYYKKIYDTIFGTYYQPKYEYWMPKWVSHNKDPSARILDIYKQKNNIHF